MMRSSLRPKPRSNTFWSNVVKSLFVASTGQNVGKTTACLGLLSGLKKRFASVGFMKPVGQESIETEGGLHVDKDVILFKEHFDLAAPYEVMSPVLFPPGFTREVIDGRVDRKEMADRIQRSFHSIQSANEFTLVEGTGHVGVGSIADLNNAQVAAILGVPMVLVARGGLGSAFDELALNKTLCEKHGVKIAGVILNRVLPDKREMVIDYMTKGLARWNIPLVGCIPYDPFLSNPMMKDFEHLFKTKLLSGEKNRLRHFQNTRLVASSSDDYHELIAKNQLIITPADREDVILATLAKHWDHKKNGDDLEAGMILTGNTPPRSAVVEELKKADIPMLFAPGPSYQAIKQITSFTAKIRKEDLPKVKEAIDVVEKHIDFSLLF
jgi:phosphate acetyltransferase